MKRLEVIIHKFYLFRVFTNESDSVCYEGLGCFNKTEPFTDLPLPWSPEEVGIEFRLYTPEGGGDSKVISTDNIP